MKKPEDIFEKIGIDQSQASLWSTVFKHKITLKKGEIWLKEGEVCQHLGIIVKGMCRHGFTNSEGDDITRWVSLESDIITSLSSFISGDRSNESIQAIATSEILFADKHDWLLFFSRYESVRQYWTKTLEQYLIGLEERLFNQISKKAQDRYNYLHNKYPRLIREVPNKYIASILGINSRHLSRLRLK
ncbi:Crp/Fnr family transcriptional regulator [Flavivirga rizhaonensis]|uniref:Crp/Fnr family transcriptional regulator n=1 Tax=Flavivirga rizhaonensis TaxID=2559571 RepID=A0A4S1DS63_9FLAO|nr:Crp/Fnr family transcriptional regulator [Flavivirga rizhaonensis]TGV00739.1 Crp/Fnr family transcriptional regulator [Flavivirga rizhaonensis]